MNKETAAAQARLNMVDQYGPGGNSVFQETGQYSDGTPKFRQDVALSPTAQGLYDSQNSIQQKALDLGQGAIGRVQGAIAQPFDVSSLPGQVFGVEPGKLQSSVGPTGEYQSSVPGQTYQQSVPGQTYQQNVPGQQYQTTFGDAGPIQRQIANSSDYAGSVKSVQDALMARMAPQIEQDRTRLETKLANQGITGTSDAYGQAQFRQEQNINDQRTAAMLAASQEQTRLAALDAQAGNFANNAQQQAYGQEAGRGTFANDARGRQFTTDLAAGDFGNNAKRTQFETDLAGGNFTNSAKGAQFGTDMAGATLNNDTVRQRLVDALSRAEFGNNAQAQQFGQGVTNANMQNAGRQTGIQEAAYLRGQPFNELASLMGFAPGVQVPQFQNPSGTGIAPPDYQGAVAQKYAGDMQAYQMKQQQNSSLLGSIFGMAGAGLGGWGMGGFKL